MKRTISVRRSGSLSDHMHLTSVNATDEPLPPQFHFPITEYDLQTWSAPMPGTQLLRYP